MYRQAWIPTYLLPIQYRAPHLSGFDSGYHCLAIVNSDKLFLTGLGEEHEDTWLYSKTSDNLTKLNPMPTGREQAGCGVVRDGFMTESMIFFF